MACAEKVSSDYIDAMREAHPQGWLWKRGVTNTKFRRRWFVLTPSGEALYYKSPPMPGSQAMLQGSFGLMGARIDRPAARPGNHGRLPIAITLVDRSRTYHLEVEGGSHENLSYWYDAFMRAAASARVNPTSEAAKERRRANVTAWRAKLTNVEADHENSGERERGTSEPA